MRYLTTPLDKEMALHLTIESPADFSDKIMHQDADKKSKVAFQSNRCSGTATR
jgi:hypothetical protein